MKTLLQASSVTEVLAGSLTTASTAGDVSPTTSSAGHLHGNRLGGIILK